MTGLLILRAPAEHWHPRSVAHLALLREIAALAPSYLSALTSDTDDAPTQARMERLLRALPQCAPSGEIVRVPPAQARRLLEVSDAAWVVWRQLLALRSARGRGEQERWTRLLVASIEDLAWAVSR